MAVRVGVIGLGEVAQITHLPILESLAGRFEIAALCDISQELLEHMGKRYNVSRLYTDYHALAEQPDLDAVLVLSNDEYHADATIRAANNGKHVLVEKPMCLSMAEADAIIKARDEAGVSVMVGYMRRFAPAFLSAKDEVKALGKINYARIHDIIGANRLIIEQSSVVHRPTDIPREASEGRAERARQLVHEAIGEASACIVTAYRQLGGLGSHDLSAMREIIGMPNRVISAVQWNDGRFLSALFEYDDFNAVFEMGVDNQRRFDAHIEVYGESKSVRIQYDTPYIRHLPTTLHVHETRGDAYEERVERPTFTDPYTEELCYFHDVVTKGTQPKTAPEDFTQDLKLFRMIVESLRK